MAGYFGNAVTLGVDDDDNASFTAVGEVLSISSPGEEFDRIDFTVLGDTVQQMALSPVQNAPEWEFSVLMDRTQAEQATIEGLIGSDTAHTWQIVFPWGSANTLTFEAKVYAQAIDEVVSKDSIKQTFSLVNTTVNAWA